MTDKPEWFSTSTSRKDFGGVDLEPLGTNEELTNAATFEVLVNGQYQKADSIQLRLGDQRTAPIFAGPLFRLLMGERAHSINSREPGHDAPTVSHEFNDRAREPAHVGPEGRDAPAHPDMDHRMAEPAMGRSPVTPPAPATMAPPVTNKPHADLPPDTKAHPDPQPAHATAPPSEPVFSPVDEAKHPTVRKSRL